MTGSMVTCEIDLPAKPRQSGYLREPRSNHDSTYGWIGVPLHCLAHEHGAEHGADPAAGGQA